MASRQLKWVVLGVVLILAVVTGVLIATSNRGDSSASGDVTQTVTVPPTNVYDKVTDNPTPSSDPVIAVESSESSQAASSTAEATSSAAPDTGTDGRAPTNIPMTKLAPGEKAPQFIIFSFDGVGSSAKLQAFTQAAKDSNARFTGFLTGIYLIDDSHADVYQAPGANQGSSEVGFGGQADEVAQRVTDLNAAYLAGNEIGTHYNGHFCGLGANWSTAEWNSELDQNFNFLTNWKTIDGISSAPDLAFPTSEVKGGRTPCLAGQLDQLEPAWVAHGFTYDSSMPAPRDGIFWPEKLNSGIWEFYMPRVYSAGLGGMVTAMDYNFWVKFNNGAEQPSTQPELTQKVLDTYRYMYQQAYNGNRAPVLIANHFNNWNGNSFNPATEAFMREACVQPDTYCATYQDVITWMQLQDPAVLQELQDQGSVAYQ